MIAPDSPRLEWWHGLVNREPRAHSVVLGIRRTGKSSFFSMLAEENEDVFYWDSLRAARIPTVAEVWAQLFDALGHDHDPLDDPKDSLHEFLDERPSTVTLIVDGWDQAVEPGPDQANDASYEVLDALARFCIGHTSARSSEESLLGLVLISSLPDVADLEGFARRVQRPTFERLSGLIVRLFIQDRFPFLGTESSLEYLRTRGVDGARAAEIAASAGGWFWLLEVLADTARNEPARGRPLVPTDYRAAVLSVVDAAVLTSLDHRPEARRNGLTGLAYLERLLQRGESPESIGLPADPLARARLAPALRNSLSRTTLFLDVENVLMPHLIHFKEAPWAYPRGLDSYLAEHTGAWLDAIQKRYDLDDEDVCFVGVSLGRINRTVGVARLGRRVAVPKSHQEKSLKANGANKTGVDDIVLATEIMKVLEEHPLGDVILLTGDADIPQALHVSGKVDRIVVHAPWGVHHTLDGILARGSGYFDFTFPAVHPTEESQRR